MPGEYDRRRPRASLPGRATGAALVVALLSGLTWAEPPAARGAGPHAQAAAEFLAGRDGGRSDDYALVYERGVRIPHSGEQLWAGKLVDARTGQIRVVYRGTDGALGGPEMLRGRERAAAAQLSALDRKASASLRGAVASAAAKGHGGLESGGATGATLPVAVWLDVDAGAAEAAVVASHPEVTWLAGRPVTEDLGTIRRLRGELWTARRDAYAAAAADLAAEVQRLGGSVAYVSTSAPLVFLDLPAGGVSPLAEREDVVSMGLEGAWSPTMSSAGPTVEANWTSGPEDGGAGIRVAVVEYHNVRGSGDLAGKLAATYSVTGTAAYTGSGSFDHPTWVAGAIAGQSASFHGVAPASVIVSAGTGGYSASLTYDRRVIAAADWAVSPAGGDADIVNTSLVQDTATGAEEARRFFDAIAYQDGRLPVSAAGNYANFNGWQIGSPGTGYNVLTVGGIDDRGTTGRDDDRIWYVPGANGSNWLDQPGTPWNAHGDFNKPNLVAPAVSVRTANGLTASGTSVATPIVAGVAAQLLANEPALVTWPEGSRAVLMAGAVHRVRMPDGSMNGDHEGVGMTSALWTGRISNAGDGLWGGYRLATVDPGQVLTQQVGVRAGDRLRVALAWSSHATAPSGGAWTDALTADLDLRVRAPDGAVIGSFSLDNAYEFVEMSIPVTGTATIEVIPTRADAGTERIGLAWAKVGDRTPPTAQAAVPFGGEPWAVGSATPQVVFSEPVSGVSASTVGLRAAGSDTDLAATLTYDAASRTVTVRPAAPLPPGSYQVQLRAGISDGAANPLAPTSASFTVAAATTPGTSAFSPARTARFGPGTHLGYQFDGSGRVTAWRSYTLPRSSSALVDRRGTLPGLPGTWLRVANGVWAGFWVRESPRINLPGGVQLELIQPTQPVRVLGGAHVGYRFDEAGRVTASRAYTLPRASSATVSQRMVINGSWHLYVIDGVWAGYWLPETPRSFLYGARSIQDIGAGVARFEAGTYTGTVYTPTGAAVWQRTFRLGRASSAPIGAWAVVNGAGSLYVTAGIWAGTWVPESTGVHAP